MHALRLALAASLLLGCARGVEVRAAPPAREPAFLRREGAELRRGARTVRFLGSSAFHLQEEAARALLGVSASQGRVEATFELAQRSGMDLLRVAAFNDGPRDRVALQPSPGVLGAEGVAGLDVVVAEARRRGVSLVLVLSNYWDDYGGLAQYLRWRGLDPTRRARAFEGPELAGDVAQWARVLVAHRNPRTGLRYNEDPTIVAWEVMNEPRGEGLSDDGAQLASFVRTVARALRDAAPRQLVLAGDEGFERDARGYDEAWWREHAPSMVGSGRHESAALLAAEDALDGSTVHLYPAQWGVARERWSEVAVRWLRAHARSARERRKPLWVEEFGVPGPDAAEWREVVFREAHALGAAALLPWGLRDRLVRGDTDELAWQREEGGVDAVRAQLLRWRMALGPRSAWTSPPE